MKRIIFIISCSLSLWMTGCEKDTEPNALAPTVITGTATDEKKPGIDITLTGTVTPHPKSKVEDNVGFMIASTEESIIINNGKVEMYPATLVSKEQYQYELPRQEPGTYYYCIYASSGYSYVKGEIKSFIIEKDIPTLGNLTEIAVNDDNATVRATLIRDGGLETSEKGFCWSTSNSEPTIDHDERLASLNMENTFEATIKELKYNTEYYIRAYAINSKGTAYSSGFLKIKTASSDKPELANNMKAFNPTSSTIDVSATISNDGGAAITEKGFCYSSTKEKPTVDDKRTDGGNNGNELKTTIKGLRGHTAYYIRAYAINKNGVAYSNTVVETTKKTDPTIDDPLFPGKQ